MEDFIIQLLAALDRTKSKKQINADIKALQSSINMLRLTGTFTKGDTKKELNSYIKTLENQLSQVKLKAKIDSKNLKSDLDKALNNASYKDIDLLNVDESKTKLKVRKVVADAKAFVDKNSISINVDLKKQKLKNDLTAYINRYSKIKESSVLLGEAEKVRNLIEAINDKKSLREATDSFQLFKSQVTSCGFATKGTTDRIKDMISHITKIASLFGVASLAVSSFRKSLQTLKEVDTYLTEISKANDRLTKSQLAQIGNDSFAVASKYGKTATNYLSAVQEMSRAGYEDAAGLSELSVAAQGAGDMTQELANRYIIATDKAYKLGGSVEKLTAVLDGSNYITNHNAVNMTELSEAMSIVGSTAASFGVEVNQTTAALGTMIATTQQSGSEVARAFRAILLNIRQVTDEEEGIDAEGLTKYEAACKALNVSLKETKNGITSLRNPMQVLKELSEAYNKLEESDIRRTNLLSSVGGKLRSTQLDALLRQWDTYEKMLQEYANGTGSMAIEAEKTAKSFAGLLNALQNSWDSFVNSLTNKDAIMGGISFFDRLIQGAEGLTNAIGEIPVLLTTVNSAMTAMNKDYGITQLFNKETGKFDVQGNIFGIDFSAIKAQKKHFAEAEEALSIWNDELVSGKANVESFNFEVVKNNAQLKQYLATTSTEAPASLNGYKSYLNKAGVSTDALRLKTVLLNAAISMGIGIAIQAAVQGLTKLINATKEARQRAQELGAEFTSAKLDIESYKEQIEELYKTINDSSSSIEDVTNARKTLMSVQDEMIDKFGNEKSVIDNVTDAINGQTEALDRLTQAKWQETKNKFNDGDFWNNAVNFLQGTDNIQRMLDEYGEKTITFKWADYADITDLTDQMISELENIGVDIKVSTDNLQAIRDFDSLTESITDTNGAMLSVTGNAEEIYNQLLALQNLIGNDDSFNKLYDRVEDTANSYKDLTDLYKEFYDQYILYEKILTDGSDYADVFKEITDAYEEYTDAFASGDEGKIKEATEKYASIVSDGISTAIANGDNDVATYFENMYPTLKSIVSGWKFNVAFDANTDDLQTKVQSVIDGLKDENGRQFTTEEILGLGSENEQYRDLVSIAHSYNMTLEEMIALLKERNMVADMDYQSLVGLFGQKNVDSLTPEDIEIAYTIKNIGKISFDELVTEIQSVKDEANATITPALSVSETIDQLNDQLKPAFDSLKSAYEDIFTTDGFTLENVDLSMLDSIKSAIDEINKNNAGFYIDYSSFEELARVLTDTSSTADDVHNAINALATEIVGGLTPSLSECSGENYKLVQSLLESMGIMNSEEVMISSLGYSYEEYIAAKEEAALAGFDLANATESEINAFVQEQIESGNCGEALALLQLKKLLVNGVVINTVADIQQILGLANSAGVAANALVKLANAKAMLEHATAIGDTRGIYEAKKYAREITSEIQNEVSNFEMPAINFDPSGSNTKAASKAGKKTADEYVEAFNEELSKLQDLRDRGVIDEAEYLNRLKALYIRYFADRKEYLDEFKKYESEYINGMVSLHNKALSGISTLLNKRISAANESKSAIIDSLNEEKEAAQEAYQAQIDAIEEQKKAIDDLIKQKQKQIDAINEEIDKIEKAAETRKKNLDLQQQEYNLQKMLNQKTQAVYKEGKGFVFEADTSGIREAKEKLTEAKEAIQIDNLKNEISLVQKEIDLLEEKKDSLSGQQEQLQKMLDASNKYYENLIKEQEKYWDSLIKNMENQKSKWEELADIQQVAEAWSAIEQIFGELGYTVEDVLNGNEQAFEDFKAKYISLLSDMNSNASFAEGLSYASGVAKEELGSFLDKTKETADGLDTLGSKGTELDSVASSMNNLSGSASTASQTVSDTATNLNDAATNAGILKDNLTDVSTTISEEQTAFDNLKKTIDEVIQAINDKITAIQEEQRTVGIATSSEMADFLLLRDKILEVKESINDLGDSVTDLDTITLDNITDAFTNLHTEIASVATALGSGIEGSGEGVTNSISSAIQALNDISLEEGIISQFNNLKTAIDEVTAAISGGGGSSGGQSQGGQSGTSGSSSESGSQGGAANSLSGAITQMGTTANEVIGQPDSEGDGTVIGEFGSFKTAVNETSEAIGNEDSQDEENLIGSINDLGETTNETLGESGGDGVIGRFEQFKDVIGEADEHVRSISDGLAAIDGQEVECTITINIKQNGSTSGLGMVAGSAMNLNSGTYNAKMGSAHVEGTALVSGNWAVQSDEKSALMGELGYEIIVKFLRLYIVIYIEKFI